MPSITRSMRLLTDSSRLRIVLLLENEELSVAELQEILAMGQSRISTYLSQLKREELVEDRRAGKNIMYQLRQPDQWKDLLHLAHLAAKETPEAAKDGSALQLVLRKRSDRSRAYFDELAGKFGKEYVPGRSWRGLAETLLALLPPMMIADLGTGEGMFAQFLARRAKKVIAVDHSEKMIAYATSAARRNGIDNIEFRLGDLENPPVEENSVDLAFFSQTLHHAPHPQLAISAAYQMLRPGGRIVILDLKRHNFSEARELYADLWLGFPEVDLLTFLETAGFTDTGTWIVHREEESPAFETVLAMGTKSEALSAEIKRSPLQ